MSTDSSPFRTVVVELTERCNLRCRMCWWWGDAGIAPARAAGQDELALAEWRAFVDDVSPYRPHLRFTGGEPLVRPDVFDVIEYARARGLGCSMITNGTRLDAAGAARLVAAGVEAVTFSLHGDAAADAAVRGHGAFEQTLAALEALLAARQPAARPHVMINCVITPHNLESLPAVIALGRRLGVHVRLQHLMWYDQATVEAHRRALRESFGRDDATLQGFVRGDQAVDVARLLEILAAEGYLRPRNPGGPSHTVPALSREDVERWYTDLAYCGVTGCEYVTRAARVKANGDVVACPFVEDVWGNVRERSLRDIVVSAPARRFREAVARHLLPGCTRCCKLDW